MLMLAVGQSLICDCDCSACAFRNVLASHFSMDAASKTALGAVHSEETAHFGQNAIEGARLVAIASLDDIAMHRVAGPDDPMAFALNCADEPAQAPFDLIMPIAPAERHASRLPPEIAQVKHALHRIWPTVWTPFHAHWITHTPHNFTMTRCTWR